MIEPLHRIGLLILAVDTRYRHDAAETGHERDVLAFRYRRLTTSVLMTDAKLETAYDGLNRANLPARFRMEQCRVLELLEHRLESTPDPILGDDDVDA
ncbi:MAG TPA: hypothetical protein VIL88_02500 [Devosia sp.]|jgi:hypothetical protein|uniref:hypothetical protein n=1 Tax=Devosia sp. TaxID=1871048 RepID=UPI002F945322